MEYKEKYEELLKIYDQTQQELNTFKSSKTREGDNAEVTENILNSFSKRNNISLKDYFDSIPTPVAITTAEEKVVLINKAFTQLFELTLQDISNKTIDEFLKSQKATLKTDNKLMLDSDYSNKKIYTINKVRDGNRIYVSYMRHSLYADANLTGYIVLFYDITTEIKKYDFLEILFNVSTLAIRQNDLKEIYPFIVKELGRIWDTTNFFIALYNKEEEKVSFPFFIDEKDRFEEVPTEKTATGYVIKKNQPLLLKENDLKKLEDAGELDLIGAPCKVWMGAPMQVKDDISGVICLQDYQDVNKFSDDDLNMLSFIANHIASIIQRKILITAQESAEKTAKAKQLFISTMSHEIRTPLNEIIGVINMLVQGNPREDQMELVKTLKFSSNQLLMLVNDILDFNKIESKKVVFEHIIFNISNFLDDIVRIYSLRSNEKNLKFEYVKDSKLPNEVIGDPVRLSQILSNILSNALKFTQEGGIKLTVNVLPQSEKQIQLEFMISDTGIGIPQERHASIFETYVQASSDITRQFGGTGLGLAICKNLIELQNGTLSFKSELGKGTTFIFTLPFGITDKLPEPKKEEVDTASLSLEGKKILVAEDNKINFFVVNKFLTGWGIQVTHAENGQLALDKLKEQDFDLILMDLQMPVMDGIEASRIIRNSENKKLSTIPIIALTAALISENQEKFTDLLINDYILKPFKPQDLFERISKHIR